jgi:2-oxoisovalerate dehydrogenase E1 component alpha subunit
MVSRLYGHSSASGANFVKEETDCLKAFEGRLESSGILKRAHMEELRARFTAEMAALARKVREEPQPDPESIWRHVYWEK